MKIIFLLFFLIFLTLISCNPKKINQPYPGFELSNKGFYFKRITIGDGINSPQVGDSVYLKVVFKDSLKNIIFNSSESILNGCLGFEFCGDKNNNIEQALFTMVEGDSTHFIIVADSLYKQAFNIDIPRKIQKGQNIRVEAIMLNHKTKARIASDKKNFDVWSKEMLLVEQAKLSEYVRQKRITQKPDSQGIISLTYFKGNGPIVFTQPFVWIYFKGTFFNGKEFDNSYKTNEPLQYFPGNSGQLIKGLEKIVGGMKIGAKAKLIIPSQLAFGSSGSSTGIVAPFTTIIYEFEIKKEKLNAKESI